MVSCGAIEMAHWESLKWYEKYLGRYFLKQKKKLCIHVFSVMKKYIYTFQKKRLEGSIEVASR